MLNNSMAFFDKNESYLGVDIGAGGIKLVELRKNKGRPQLWTYGIVEEPLDIHVKSAEKTSEELLAENRGQTASINTKDILPTNELVDLSDPRIERYANLLKELIKTTKARSRRVTASLPVSYIFHTTVTLPYIEKNKQDAVVRAEVAKVLTRPIEEMQIVYQEIPQPNDGQPHKYLKLLVTAAPKALVAFYTAIFQRAGLQLTELETEAFALERSLVGRDVSTTMVLDIGSERTNFFIIDQGLPATHRTIQIGGNNIDSILARVWSMDPKLVPQGKHDISTLPSDQINENLFTSITDPMIKEIEYGFDLYLKQTGNEGKKPEKIVLSGGSAVFPPIQKKIKENFDIKVFVGDPWARVVYQQALKSLLDEVGPRMAVSIGLALRNIL